MDGTRTELGKKRYSWLQDVLGYDERDRAREAAADAKRSSQEVLKAQYKLDQSRQARKNAGKRGDKATSILENWGKTQFHSYPANYSGTQYNTSADMVRAWQEVQSDEYAEELAKQLESIENMDLLNKAIAIYNGDRNWAAVTLSDYRKTPLGVIDSAKATLAKGATFIDKVLSVFKRKDKVFTAPTTSRGHSTHPKTGVGGEHNVGAPGDKVFLGNQRKTRR